MTGLTPRYEPITGVNLSGSDGDSNRTYTLGYSNYYSVINFQRQGADLHETDDFTISGGVVTFLGPVFNDQVISLRYFTTDTASSIVAGYGYCSTADIYRTSGLTSSLVLAADIADHILEAETLVCRLTKNIYWNIVLDSQTATGGAANTIIKTSAGWVVNDLTGLYVWWYSGTGSVQLRKILSNTVDTITVDRAWTTTNPTNGCLFKIFYVPEDFNPYVSDLYNGNNQSYFFIPYYPVKKVETLSIVNPAVTTSVTPSNLYLWEKIGRIQFKTSAEATLFAGTYPQEVSLSYWYGVDNLPYDIKRLVEVRASIQSLSEYIMTVANTPSNVSMPELTIVNPQAYQVAISSRQKLEEEYDKLLLNIKIWPVFG